MAHGPVSGSGCLETDCPQPDWLEQGICHPCLQARVLKL